jgi:hypothetical protein
MNIAIAAALLIMLLVHVGKKNKPAQPAPKKAERDDLFWIDELEALDAIMDDFI